MFLALRELVFARGRFALMGAVVALIDDRDGKAKPEIVFAPAESGGAR